MKSRHGLPVYVPEREAAMLASRRQEAENLGVPPDLIEDVLRRVMRESYVSENDKGFKTLCPQLRPIVIIGGNGQMGRLFNRLADAVGLSGQGIGSGRLAAGGTAVGRRRHGDRQRADPCDRAGDKPPANVARRLYSGGFGVGEEPSAACDAGGAQRPGGGAAPDVRPGRWQCGEAGSGLLRWPPAGGLPVVA